jgi:hypothetical protein
MESTRPNPEQIRPKPTRQHRKQVFWQIWLPLLVCVALVLFLAVITSISAGTAIVTKWSYLSTIFIFLTLLTALIYGLTRLIGILPVYTRLVQDYFFKAAIFIRLWSNKAIAPLLSSKAGLAGIRAFLSHFGF